MVFLSNQRFVFFLQNILFSLFNQCPSLTLLNYYFITDGRASDFMGLQKNQMYFPLVFEVTSRACFTLTPAAPFIVYSVLLLVSFWYLYSLPVTEYHSRLRFLLHSLYIFSRGHFANCQTCNINGQQTGPKRRFFPSNRYSPISWCTGRNSRNFNQKNLLIDKI